MPLFVSRNIPTEAVHVLSISDQFHIYQWNMRGLLFLCCILLLSKLVMQRNNSSLFQKDDL